MCEDINNANYKVMMKFGNLSKISFTISHIQKKGEGMVHPLNPFMR